MTKKQRAQTVMTELEKLYPVIPVPLDHSDPYTLLVAVALSAQTTDKKVNQITPKLFEVAGDPFKMKDLEVDEIRFLIKEIGLANTKAKNASIGDYRQATGFESLMGWLSLTNQNVRLDQLISEAIRIIDEGDQHNA